MPRREPKAAAASPAAYAADAVLRGWLEAARSSADEMRRLVSAARELAIAGDLDAHIVRLGGDLASSPSADLAPRLHTDLRDLRAALSALTRS